MKREELFEAIGKADPTLLERSERRERKRYGWVKWVAIAACLCLAVGIPFRLLWRGTGKGGSGHGGDGSTVFMSYAGPVFPLTALEGGEGVTARREVTLDFAPWVSQEGGEGGFSSTDILVTDRYTLTNPTGEDRTVRVLYPFASALASLGKTTPELTADGTALDAELIVGAYSGGFQPAAGDSGESGLLLNLEELNSWEEYKALLEDGSYLADALSDAPDFSDIPVVVYRFTDEYGPEASKDIPNPTIRAVFSLDYDQTTVLTYGFNQSSYDRANGSMGVGFSIPRVGAVDYGEPHYLIVVGEDIGKLETAAYVTGGWDTKETLDNAGVTIAREETSLDAILREVAEKEVASCLNTEWMTDWPEGLDFETYYSLLCRYLICYGTLSDDAAARYGTGSLEDEMGDVESVQRVCYLSAEVQIPAGESVTLTATMCKAASLDYYCSGSENVGIMGYDLVTKLGSSLTFTGMTATLEDRGEIEIVRQNFGFDLENGVKTVALDPEEEHYYLEVREK